MSLKKKAKRFLLRTLGRVVPSDIFSHWFPVSVKGVCLLDGKVVLLKNERQQWDLPGGKLKKNETLKGCLIREVREELNIEVTVKEFLHAGQVRIMNMVDVIILIYRCQTDATRQDIQISHENFGIGLFSRHDLKEITLPDGYSQAILRAFDQAQVST